MDKITLFSSKVEIAENNANGNYVAKFVLCDFDPNKNGVQLNRDTIENWMASIINNPLVGKIKGKDFSSHNAKIVVTLDSNGNPQKSVEFDTDAFGTFTGVSIETIDDTECLVATCEIWKRFPKACALIMSRINSGTLHSSWEISVNEFHMDGDIKVIDSGILTAHCLLAANVEPAYDSSRLLEVAENQYDTELETAYLADIDCQAANISNEEEVNMKKNKENVAEEPVAAEASAVEENPVPEVPETSETEPAATPVAEPEVPETSSLTTRDVHIKLNKACSDKVNKWIWVAFVFPAENYCLCEYDQAPTELSYLRFDYTIEGDEVTVSEPTEVKLEVSVAEINSVISEKNDALIKANEKLQEIQSELETLKPYKEMAEKAETERIEAEKASKRTELAEYAKKSGLITEQEISEDETISNMIAELDEAGIKNVIATRFMDSLIKKVEISEVVASTTKNETPHETISLVDDDEASASLLKAYLGK